jgi:diguanylate cyclase (GGDEF)-like protein
MRIVNSFDKEVQFNGTRMTASTSVGVAVFPEDGDQEESLYKSADVALYEAKHSGRNTWRYSAAI